MDREETPLWQRTRASAHHNHNGIEVVVSEFAPRCDSDELREARKKLLVEMLTEEWYDKLELDDRDSCSLVRFNWTDTLLCSMPMMLKLRNLLAKAAPLHG